jgi:predicted amidohydrolase
VTRVAQKSDYDRKDKLCVAIGNAELKLSNFKAALDHDPNRCYRRYRDLSIILDAAIEQKVDLLVLPENYLPLEWLPSISRFCANNQMGIVTGIEHIVSSAEDSKFPEVYNLTAVILPYEHDRQKFAHVTYHNKVKYSPEEKLQIEGYHCSCHEGNSYQLFCWHDIWFPVYCCFELASIHDRALFRYYSDLIVAVEWNSDINYFGSIIESMCRDLHCYCIQANSSGPGDSRVLQPTRSEQRDIIKTKGGKNPCILTADIDIKALREYQSLSYSMQKDNPRFKPTPPDFNLDILQKKRDGTLFDFLRGKENA